MRKVFLLASIAVFLAVFLLSLKLAGTPWAIIFFSFVILIALQTFIAGARETGKVVLVNCAAVFFALGAYEIYLREVRVDDAIRRDRIVTTGYRHPHDVFGYAPGKDNIIIDTKHYDDALIYDVTYSIDSAGLRVSPPINKEGEDGCVLFFGGSFTFGIGVNDDDAMPYQVGVQSNGRFRIYNFGFDGYGPHQMLAALESGLVEDIVECKPDFVIYQAIVGHYRRAAGLAEWDSSGPRYVLSEDKVVHIGSFNSEQRLVDRFFNQLNKSNLFTVAVRRGIIFRDAHAKLLVGIVESARDTVEEIFPKSEFHVLLWPDRLAARHEFTSKELERRGIRTHLISDIRDASSDDGPWIIEHNGHPTALTHLKIAEYVISRILPP